MKTDSDANSITICEKLCDAITESAAFRAISRVLSRSQNSISTPDSSLSPNLSSETVSVMTKPAAQPSMVSVDRKVTLLEFEVPIYKNSQVPVKHAAVDPARQLPFVGAKAKSNSDSAETSVQIVSRQGRSQRTEEEARASKVDARAADIALKFAPEPSPFPVLEKTKSKTATESPIKRAVRRSTYSRSTMESTITSTLMQDEKPKPHTEKIPPTKTSGGRDDALAKNEPEGQNQGSEDAAVDINHRVSAFISREKLRIRTMSDAEGTKGSPEKDSKLDLFGNYIHRAKMKLQTMSSFCDDGGKSVQPK